MRIESAAADQIAARAQLLAAHAVQLSCALAWPEPREEPAQRARLVEDATLHLRSLSDAILAANEQLFIDYVDWARTTLEARQAPPNQLTDQLTSLRNVLYDELPEAASAAETFLSAAMARLSTPSPEVVSEVGPDTLAARYLNRLLAYDRNGALQLVSAALVAGCSLREVYLDVVQRVQHEIGRLWQLNRISVAQEHYCTAVSQLALAQLYPQMMHGPGGEPMVATCVAEELHELGARMVADFFEMNGWDTTYVGANTPPEGLLQVLRKRGARLLAISTTMGFHVHGALALIRQVRATPDLAHVKILVGGRPFSVANALWKQIGADGYASDADEAVRVGRKLLGLSEPRGPILA